MKGRGDMRRAGVFIGIWLVASVCHADGGCDVSTTSRLLPTLKDADWEARDRGVQDLVKCGDKALPTILLALGDREWRSRESAARAAAGIGPSARPAVSALAAALREAPEGESFAREALATALGAIGPTPEGIAGLIEALNHPDRGFRTGDPMVEAALNSLAGMGVSAIPALMNNMDANPAGFGDTCEALARMGPLAVPALIEAMQKGGMRAVGAVNALRIMDPRPYVAIPALTSALSNGDATVRMEAASALGNMGPRAKDAVPALIGLLEDEDHLSRDAAATALGNVGPEARSAVPALTKVARGPDQDGRRVAIEALRKIEAR